MPDIVFNYYLNDDDIIKMALIDKPAVESVLLTLADGSQITIEARTVIKMLGFALKDLPEEPKTTRPRHGEM